MRTADSVHKSLQLYLYPASVQCGLPWYRIPCHTPMYATVVVALVGTWIVQSRGAAYIIPPAAVRRAISVHESIVIPVWSREVHADGSEILWM